MLRVLPGIYLLLFVVVFVVAGIGARPVTEHDQSDLPSPYPADMLKPGELQHVWQAGTTQEIAVTSLD
jgi:hypothetical protein